MKNTYCRYGLSVQTHRQLVSNDITVPGVQQHNLSNKFYAPTDLEFSSTVLDFSRPPAPIPKSQQWLTSVISNL